MKNNNLNLSPTKPEYHKKGWGYEIWLTNDDKYCGKILRFEKGKRCSYHYHKMKSEHFFVQRGGFLLKLGWTDNYDESKEIKLEVGDVIEIPTGLRHQMIALEDSDIIEISTHHSEEDSFRIKKGD